MFIAFNFLGGETEEISRSRRCQQSGEGSREIKVCGFFMGLATLDVEFASHRDSN